MVAAIVEPLAVVPLIFQIVLTRDGGGWAIFFIVVELLVLTGLLIVAFADIGPSQDEWMRSRVRTEVLRRERFLVLARVGPYLRTPDPSAMVDERLRYIGDDVTEPDALILLEDIDGKSWRNALEEAGPGATAAPDRRCLDEFGNERLAYQEQWYEHKRHEHEAHFRVQEALLRTALVVAVVLSAMHLMSLLPGGGHGAAATAGAELGAESGQAAVLGHQAPSELMAQVINIPPQLSALAHLHVDLLEMLVLFALILPAVSAAVFALQTFLECRRLSRTYHRQAIRLQRLMAELVELRAMGPSPEREHRLKRLVLDTEGILAEELLQWWLHAYRY